MAVRIQLRRDTAANWSSVNPILRDGEMGVESDTLKVKVGNGSSTWSLRPYINVTPAELSELAQDSVNSAIVAGTGLDKTYDDVNNTITIDIDSTVATLAGSQTLSNKILTTPTINGPEITATGGTPRIHGIYLPEPHFITFEGATTNEFETVLTTIDPTADRTISLPNSSGTIALTSDIAELSQDAINDAIVAGVGLDKVYNDTANTITLDIDSTVSTKEYVDSAVASLGNSLPTSYIPLSLLGQADGVATLNSSGDVPLTQLDSTVVITTAAQTLTNKTLTSPVINTPTGITKSDVGLANVDNTTDANKPISTATQTALDLKANTSAIEELAQDAVNTAIFAGVGIDKIYDDATNTITIDIDSTVTTNSGTQTLTNKTLTSPIITGTPTLPTGTITSEMILDGTIANVDISATAAIALSKLATDPLSRANHTGQQAASTISDFTEAAQDAIGDVIGSGLIYSDASGGISVDLTTIQSRILNVTDTEIGYLDGVSSSIQTQLNNKLASATAATTYAPIASPTFTGTVTIPSGANISGFATLASPDLTGVPTAPTAISSTNTTQLATTAYVKSVVSDLTNGASAAYDTLKELQDLMVADDTATTALTTLVGTKAPIASPTFTGTVTIPTGAVISSPTISGTGTIAGTFTGNLTGNVTGNVTGTSGSTTGNAATVTNGVYTTGSYSNPTWLSLNSLAVGLGNVENTALSTWPGSTAIVSLGTVTAGTWNAIAISPTKGGTGIDSYTTGDIIYSSATNTLSKLPAGTNGQILTLASGVPSWQAAPVTLPTQTSNSGKYLTTNGTTASWATVDTLPSQTSNSGKYLTTDGTTPSWATFATPYAAPTIGGVAILSGGNFTSFSNLTLSQTSIIDAVINGSVFTGNVVVPTPVTDYNASTKLYTDTKANAVAAVERTYTDGRLETERTYTNGRLEIVPLDDVSTDFNGSNTRFIPKVGGAKITISNPLRLLVNINGIIQMLGNQDNHWLSPIVPDGFYIDSEGYMQFGEPVPTGSTFDARLMSGKTSNTLEKSRYPFRATDILLGA